jgi:MscS family membrane protein
MSQRFAVYLTGFICMVLLVNSYSGNTQPASKTTPARQAAAAQVQQPAPTPTPVPPASGSDSKVLWWDYAKKIGLAIGIVVVASVLIKYISLLVILLSNKTNILKKSVGRLVLFAKIILWTILLYWIFIIIIAPPVETAIILLASAGLSLSLALQDILKNIVNGFTILVDQLFHTGDQVRIGSVYGQVYKMGLRQTQILTPDDTIVTIPNSEIIRQGTTHYQTDASHSAINVDIFLPPEVDMVLVKKVALRAAEVSRYIYLAKPIQIFLSSEIQQGRLVLRVTLRAFILNLGYESLFRSEVTEVIVQELLQRGLINEHSLTRLAKI